MSNLYHKYEVRKVVGETDLDAQYSVFRVDFDHHVRVAQVDLTANAESVRGEVQELFEELMLWLGVNSC